MKYVSLFFGILNMGCVIIGTNLGMQIFNLLVGATCITLFVYEQDKERNSKNIISLEGR